jgi:membrane dipeptidase
MLVDISHVSVDTMHDALRITRAPVIASHSSAFGVAPHPRNVPDDVLREVAANGGVIMVNFFPSFTQPQRAAAGAEAIATVLEKKRTSGGEVSLRDILKNTSRQNDMPRGSVHTIVDHIEHIIRVAGIDHVGLGSDYDGIESVPDQLEDVSCYPYITQEMLNRGYSAEDIRKVLGGNVERALRQAERVAQEIRDEDEKQ